MTTKFAQGISKYVKEELVYAKAERALGNSRLEFEHLENAHVLGQESTYWHVRVHTHMLLWAIRNAEAKEALGQIFRIVGAATKTAFGLVPIGNTGGTNVSPFKSMPVKASHQEKIRDAKAEV